MTFAERLDHLIGPRGRSEAARWLGVSRWSLIRYASGRSEPSQRTLRRIAARAGVPVGALVHGDPTDADAPVPETESLARRLVADLRELGWSRREIAIAAGLAYRWVRDIDQEQTEVRP